MSKPKADAEEENAEMDWNQLIDQSSLTDWLLVALTMAYVVVTWRQLRALKRSNIAANDNARAAAANAESARLALDSAKRAERPWITFEMTGFDGEGNLDSFWKDPSRLDREKPELVSFAVRGFFRNGGRTPARVLNGSISAGCVVEEALPANPDYGVNPALRVPEALLMPGRATVETVVPFFVTNAHMKALVASERILIVYGFTLYRDVWDHEHEARFSLVCCLPRARLGQPVGFRLGGPDAYNRIG